MSRRHPPIDRRRGRHKKATSPEVRAFLALVESKLEDAPQETAGRPRRSLPRRPPWMSEDAYRDLAELRRTLEVMPEDHARDDSPVTTTSG